MTPAAKRNLSIPVSSLLSERCASSCGRNPLTACLPVRFMRSIANGEAISRSRTLLWNSLTTGGLDRSNAHPCQKQQAIRNIPDRLPFFAASVDDALPHQDNSFLEPRR